MRRSGASHAARRNSSRPTRSASCNSAGAPRNKALSRRARAQSAAAAGCRRRRSPRSPRARYPQMADATSLPANSLLVDSGDHRRERFCFTCRSLYLCASVPIPFSKKSRRNVVRASENGARASGSTRVGLRPAADWHKRNFITRVLIPSMFTRRAVKGGLPLFPKLKAGEVCITWIGHASFLVQTRSVNVLIDPNWSMWLKVIKRLKKPGFDLFHLPEIDFVLVTHAHFDHLDRRTLRKVA